MRWILSVWCVFVFSVGALAQSSVRFIARAAKNRQLLPGVIVHFSQPERILKTDSSGTVECQGLKPGKHHYSVDYALDGIGKKKVGTVTLQEGKQTEVRLTMHFPEEIYQLARSKIWKTSTWMTLDHRWAYLVPFIWEAPRPPKPGKLIFLVCDVGTGKPLPYVPILLKGPEIAEPVGEEDTDADGNAVRETPPGTYHYAVVAFVGGVFYERQRGEVTVTAGNETKMAIELRPLEQ